MVRVHTLVALRLPQLKDDPNERRGRVSLFRYLIAAIRHDELRLYISPSFAMPDDRTRLRYRYKLASLRRPHMVAVSRDVSAVRIDTAGITLKLWLSPPLPLLAHLNPHCW